MTFRTLYKLNKLIDEIGEEMDTIDDCVKDLIDKPDNIIDKKNKKHRLLTEIQCSLITSVEFLEDYLFEK